MPISGRTAFVSATTSCPQTNARPVVGSSTVERIFTSVVLPAPFGPSRPCTSPTGIVSETPSSAVTGSRLRGVKTRRISWTSTACTTGILPGGYPGPGSCFASSSSPPRSPRSPRCPQGRRSASRRRSSRSRSSCPASRTSARSSSRRTAPSCSTSSPRRVPTERSTRSRPCSRTTPSSRRRS